MFQERCELVADNVCFLDSCSNFSVKSAIFCKYATEVFELGHLPELSAIDVEFLGVLLTFIALVLLMLIFMSHSSRVVFRLCVCFCNFFSSSFVRLWSSANNISFKLMVLGLPPFLSCPCIQ